MIMSIILLANAVWFGMAFHAFYIRRAVFGKVMVPVKEHRENSAYRALVESGRFMGGFNLALSLFNVCLFFNVAGFVSDSQWALLLAFNSFAHGTQFFGNVPMALKNRQGGGLWNVFKGVMLRIFVIDFILMIANAVMAAMLLI